MTRSEGSINFKEYSMKPLISSDLRCMALAMAKSGDLKKMRPASIRDQYVILGNNEYVSEDARIKMINKSNKSSFTSWDDRKYYSGNVRVVSPVLAENQTSCVTVFKCTCQKYLDEYECVHTVAMSVAKNVLPRSISMHIP